MITCKCYECNKEFFHHRLKKFCSKECKYKAESRRIKKLQDEYVKVKKHYCKQCKKLIYNRKWVQQFCCKECRIKFQGGGEQTCLFCDKKFFSEHKQNCCSHKCMHLRNKKEKIGCYHNPEMLLKGREKVLKVQANKNNRIYKGIPYASIQEMKVAKYIESFGHKIKLYTNFQFRVGTNSIDFFINKVFIEYHPQNNFYENYKKYSIKRRKAYYSQRRYILNKNGYNKYKLILIEDLRQLKRLDKYLK